MHPNISLDGNAFIIVFKAFKHLRDAFLSNVQWKQQYYKLIFTLEREANQTVKDTVLLQSINYYDIVI